MLLKSMNIRQVLYLRN
uniref:Uncharacterized protein n=1 Tax=Arundo donax TaxID=35708 RepID=A0A0A9B148_ARUDO